MTKLKIKLIKPGYPFLQEKWITVNIDIENNPNVKYYTGIGYGISRIEVD